MTTDGEPVISPAGFFRRILMLLMDPSGRSLIIVDGDITDVHCPATFPHVREGFTTNRAAYFNSAQRLATKELWRWFSTLGCLCVWAAASMSLANTGSKVLAVVAALFIFGFVFLMPMTILCIADAEAHWFYRLLMVTSYGLTGVLVVGIVYEAPALHPATSEAAVVGAIGCLAAASVVLGGIGGIAVSRNVYRISHPTAAPVVLSTWVRVSTASWLILVVSVSVAVTVIPAVRSGDGHSRMQIIFYVIAAIFLTGLCLTKEGVSLSSLLIPLSVWFALSATEFIIMSGSPEGTAGWRTSTAAVAVELAVIALGVGARWRAVHSYSWMMSEMERTAVKMDPGQVTVGADVEIPELERLQQALGGDADTARSLREKYAAVRRAPSGRFLRQTRSGECVYCGTAASAADHIRPLARGGWHDEMNLVPCCTTCNSIKGSSLLIELELSRPEMVKRAREMSERVNVEYCFQAVIRSGGLPPLRHPLVGRTGWEPITDALDAFTSR